MSQQAQSNPSKNNISQDSRKVDDSSPNTDNKLLNEPENSVSNRSDKQQMGTSMRNKMRLRQSVTQENSTQLKIFSQQQQQNQNPPPLAIDHHKDKDKIVDETPENDLRGNNTSRSRVDSTISKKNNNNSPKRSNSKAFREKMSSQKSSIMDDEVQEEEIFIPQGHYITQEDRIKNQDKIIQYPKFIIPSKHKMKATWDLLIGFFVLYSSFFSPLNIAFRFRFDETGKLFYDIGENITLAFFIFDILVNLRTTFYTSNNEECIEQKMVAKNYIYSSSFMVDLVSTLPIAEISELIVGGEDQGGEGSPSYIIWIKQLKVFRILRLAKLNRFLQSDSAKTVYQMIKIFMAFIIIYHWLTCIWFFIVYQDYDKEKSNDSNIWLPSNLRTLGQSNDNEDDKFLTKQFYIDADNVQIYSYTLYSLIILTLGNDIAPITVGQAIFSILICVAGSFLTAIFFGEIAVLIAKLNAEQTLYQNKLEKLELKLKHNQIPKVLQTKVLEYFDFCWEKKKLVENVTDFSLLSIPLQKEIHFHLHRDIIKNVPLFKELELNEIVWIIQRLKTDIYLPDDYIIREGEVGNEMFFLMDGVAKIVIKNIEDPLKPPFNIYLKKGSYVGEIGLIIDSKRTADVQAVDFTICEMFSRESYNLLKQEFPDINKRLKDGLKHYKINKIKDIQRTLKSKLFPMLDDDELEIMIRYYMDDLFCEPNKIILQPKSYSNALYVVLLGKLSQMPNTQKTHSILRQIVYRNKKMNKSYNSNQKKLKNFDEQMMDIPQEDDYNELYLKKKVLNAGEFFGALQFGSFGMKPGIENFFMSLTGCQLGIFTEKMFLKLANEQPEIFRKIKEGFNSTLLYSTNQNTEDFDRDNRVANMDSQEAAQLQQKKLGKAVQKVNDFINQNNLAKELDEMNSVLLKQLNMFEELNEQINQITKPKNKKQTLKF